MGALTDPDQAATNSLLSTAGLSPQLAALLTARAGAGAGAPAGGSGQRLQDLSEAILPDARAISGALSRQNEAYDQGAKEKINAIRAGMLRLQAAANPSGDLARLRASAALMAPTRTGRFSESLSNESNSYADAIERQRAIERQVAEQMNGLDESAADTQMGAAAADTGFLEKRIGLAGQLANQAATANYRDASIEARNMATMGRITAAQIAANKKNVVYIGLDSANRTRGIYLNKTTGERSYGPPASSTSALSDQQRLTSAISAEEGRLAQTITGMNMTPTQLHDAAVANVVDSMGGDESDGAAATPQAKPSPDQEKVLLAQARAAVAQGANKDQVKARLKQMGADPSKL